MGQPEISVVIVSYNVWPYVQACVKSVLEQQGVSCEIIVVDNNSADGSPALVHEKFPEATVIANTENKGFSGANNQGIKASKGNYILLLNPDTEIKQRDALVKMKTFLEGKGNDIVAPCLLNTDGSFQPSFWTSSSLCQLFLELFYFHRFAKKAKPSAVISVKAASGAALMFNRKLTDKIGLLDENMFWMEDIDLCYRAQKAGARISYNPAIEVIHHGGKSSSNYSVVIPNQVISKVKFYKKNGTALESLFVNVISLLFILTRLCTFAFVSLTGNGVFIQKRKAYVMAMKAYFKYNFKGEASIISDGV